MCQPAWRDSRNIPQAAAGHFYDCPNVSIWLGKALCRNTCRTVPPTEPKRRKRKEEKGAHVCIYIVIFTTRHERRSAKSTSCGRDRPQDPTFRGRTPTYQHTTYSNPRQSIQQCSDAQTCSAAADSHHNSGHDRPSHHAQTSNMSTKHECNAASIQ